LKRASKLDSDNEQVAMATAWRKKFAIFSATL
jgi:hypothetical protein